MDSQKIMGNRILPIIVTYNPDISLLQENINHLLEGCNSVLIWDNTPEGCTGLYGLQPYNKIRIISNKSNIGISRAINQAEKIADDENYDYILTMDQDSILRDIKTYIKTSLIFQDQNHCIIGPHISNKPTIVNTFDKFIEVNDIITSGAIIPVGLFNKIGGFNELFFVDAIDIEFCIRAKKYGYKIYVNFDGHLDQQFGEPATHTIFGHKFTSSNYSPFRLHGIFRNHILIGRIHGWDKHIRKKLYAYYRTFIPKIVLCEKNKWNKLKAIVLGTIEGLTLKLK